MQDFTWPGVAVGNVFKRPKATVLFFVDGLTEGVVCVVGMCIPCSAIEVQLV